MGLPDQISQILVSSTGPGGCGGIAAFLYALRQGHYKNNKYPVKLTIEILGAMIVASFIGPWFPDHTTVFASFAVGLAWAGIIQVIRIKVTKVVEAMLGENLNR
jgi:hypothetical protein